MFELPKNPNNLRPYDANRGLRAVGALLAATAVMLGSGGCDKQERTPGRQRPTVDAVQERCRGVLTMLLTHEVRAPKEGNVYRFSVPPECPDAELVVYSDAALSERKGELPGGGLYILECKTDSPLSPPAARIAARGLEGFVGLGGKAAGEVWGDERVPYCGPA